jgi:hypothetical protein
MPIPSTAAPETHPLDSQNMLVKEAEWIWSEMQDFIRLIQTYRVAYVTALFLSTGWVLGQAVTAKIENGTSSDDFLKTFQERADIAVVVSIIPIVTVLFALLMLEATLHVQRLARYHFF